MSPSPLHFLVGSTGAGKTTYAIRFCRKAGAVRFCIDEWMTALFWMDSPRPLQPDWSMERVRRCQAQMWDTAVQVARAGAPCMLEMGVGSLATRRIYAGLAKEAGLSVRFHLLDAPADVRWRRVQARNEQADAEGRLPFAVDRAMFDFTETFWESPTPEEMAEHGGVRVGG